MLLKDFLNLFVEVVVCFHIDPAAGVQLTLPYLGNCLIAPQLIVIRDKER